MFTLRNAFVVGLSVMLLVGTPVGGTGSAEAQYRRPPPPGAGGRPPRPAPNRRSGNSAAAGAAVGILGGLLIGSAIEAQRQEEARRQMLYEDAIADCARRFRSYDPESQTYVGRDGRVRRCP